MKRAALVSLLSLAAAACSDARGATPEDLYRRGLEALEAGEPKTARIELLNAIKAAPNDPKLRLTQARVYLRLADGVAAEAELKRANALGVPETETGHLMAHALLLQGQARNAVDAAGKAGPAHEPYAARMLGRAFQALGDTARAAAAFDQALALTPNDSALWSDIGRFRRSTGETAGAIEAADRAVALDAQNVEALTLRGELTRSQYGLAAGLPWFDQALEIDPEHVPALIERAATLGDLGRTRDMLADTRRIHAIVPGHPAAFYLQAVLAARGRNFDLARRLYERTKGAFEGRPAAMLLAGTIELQTGSAVQAAKRLRQLLEAQPANLKARRLLGAALLKSDDPAGAVAILKPLADRTDADPYALTLMGRSLARLGDTEGASRYLARAAAPAPAAGTVFSSYESPAEIEALRRTAAARPADAAAQVTLIRGLLSRGASGEALARARRLQSSNRGAPDAHILVGDALALQGDHRGAAAAFRQAANLAFEEPVALRLIEALRDSGDAKGAAQVLGLFLQQNPQNVPALLLSANAHLQARQWEQAIALYERVRRRIGNGDAALLNNLAWAYLETGDYDRAVPLARRAWELDPNNAATADTLGWVLFKSGEDRVQGLALLERAVQGAPTDVEIRARLARARAG
ncbi:MAG TPA: tetratricopeptide repeat protein [Allosphingosinicella sp.]